MIFILALAVTGCSTKVTRIDTDEVRDLSGLWNDTDSRLVSEEMINDMLAAPWLARRMSDSNSTPTVIVGEIVNLSHEHINANTFTGDIERAMINSGRIEFVASKNERGEIREERADQDINASEDTRKAMGQERGADYMLKGTINTIIDASGKTQVRYFQIDLNLISLAGNRMAWVGQKKIKKFVERSKIRP